MIKRLLQISVVLNLVLAGIAWWPTTQPTALPRITRTQVDVTPVSRRQLSGNASTTAAKSHWQQIDSGDLDQFIANLRAIGCPEKTIRDIVVLRVCRSYFDRLQQMEFERNQGDFRGWFSQSQWREGVYAQRELKNEMISTIESALGEPWEKLQPEVLGWPQRWPDPMEGMSLEQRKHVRDINARYDREQGDLSWNQSVEDDERLRQLNRQKRDELAKILSPQQLEEYIYRDSDAADYVRNILPQSSSEQEFCNAVRLADELGLYLAGYRPFDPSQDEEFSELKSRKALFDQRLKQLLGDDWMAQKQAEQQAEEEAERQREQQNHQEQTRAKVVGGLVKSGATTDEAGRFFARMNELQSTLGPKLQELEKSLTGTPEEKNAAMKTAVKAELNKVATEIMGSKGASVVDQFIKEMDRRDEQRMNQ